MTISNPLSIYLHIPFCSKRCGYCDFTTYAGKESLIPAYVESLCKEIRIVTDLCNDTIVAQTIFFGGGTPSMLTLSQYEEIFNTINNCFSVNQDAEISLEANPGSVNREYLKGLISLGFNRLSMGAQSTNDEELQFLGRIHTREDIFTSVQSARIAGFNNLNLDLIYGLPHQELDKWKKSLDDIIALNLEHISLYALSIEKGTPFGFLAEKGLMEIPDPDLAADMYELASEKLDNSEYQQYEISNWGKSDFYCKHNLQYWRNLPYLGFGAGAHGFDGGKRISNVLRIKDYINRIENGSIGINNKFAGKYPTSPATVSIRPVNKHTLMQETLMLGLRLTNEGVSNRTFEDRFGKQLMQIFGDDISQLIEFKLLEWDGEILRLTKHGRLLGNQVFLRFVD